MDLIIESQPHGVGIARLKGRLDLLSAGEVRQRANQAITEGLRRLIVDLGEVTLMDSSGLAVLITILKEARLAGGDLRLARPNEQARFVLQLTGLDRVLHPYATVEEALVGY